MRHFFTTLFGVKSYIEYEHVPGEEPSQDGPGCDDDVEINTVILTQGSDNIRIDPVELNDETYEQLRAQAFKDVES